MSEKKGVYTAYTENNNFLILKVSKLYLKPGDKIADITYGKGTFWKDIDLSQFKLSPSDIRTCPESPYDFRDLPYDDDSFDVVVFDPPYAHNPGNMIVNPAYQNKETTKGFYHKDIINLYKEGMEESFRIVKKGGFVFVKCQDEIETSKQRYSHIEIFNIAEELGFYGKDLFVLVRKVFPVIQHKNQKHARKNHSYLWIFQKK